MPHGFILIVEDDFDIRDALSQILEEEGYTVRAAANGREGLDALAEGPAPSVILLDLMMPVMNGWEFRAEQLKDARLASVPVLVISADPHLEARVATLGEVGILRKPIILDDLLAAIASRCPK